jgi:pyruvate dehydrogenase E1 component alpha subunit
MKPSAQQQLWMYETMCLIRHYEDSLAIAYFEGKLPPKIQKGCLTLSGPIPGEILPLGRSRPRWVPVLPRGEDSVRGTHRAHHFATRSGPRS